MKCPKCHDKDTKVVDSRVINDDRVIRRRRNCESCGYRYTTFERMESGIFVVKKRDGTIEPYTRQKLEEGIWRACTKRPVTLEQVRSMLFDLEEGWSRESEVLSTKIGEDVMTALQDLDSVAYIRFASVYKRFETVEDFLREMRVCEYPGAPADGG